MKEKNLLIELLLNELFERQERNPRYSLGKLALDLGLSRAHLSGVINGNRGLSSDLAEQMVRKVKWSKRKKNVFCELANYCFSRREARKKNAKTNLDRMGWTELLSSGQIGGMWKATERIGSKKNHPQFWNPKFDSQILIFEPNKLDYKIIVTSKNFFTSTWGKYQLDDKSLKTSTESTFVSPGCPWENYTPKISPIHEFKWLNTSSFLLNTDATQITSGTLAEKESLVTIWRKVEEI